ncbi:FAD-dependent monooxygenase [Catenulispora yoronensis]|uniref:FAD-dependent monooxygenase n=1 Tax=Catenulispora yoronensis TaxID=450799 RepID=A0ABP5GIT9_9ACTN
MNERVLVVGASIAGLTAAHWLARHGFRPTVVERAVEPRSGGNGVDLRDDAVTVVERMGLLERIRELGTDVHGMKFVDAADRTIGRIDTRELTSVEIMRGDLVALLREATDVEIRFGTAVRSLTPDADGEGGGDGDGVTVGFEHGPDLRFDLVVGADGMHSTVRRLAFGPEERFIRHKDHYFAFADAADAAAPAEDRWMTMFNAPGKMAGVWRSGNHARAKAYFVFRSEPLRYDYRDVDEHKRMVATAFADSPWPPARALLDTALADPEFYFDALGQVRMDSWSAGRVVLIGDAAWCASPAAGAGAELAVVGAYRLAGELAAADGDHRVAFPRFEAAHRPLVARSQQIGPNVGVMIPRTETGLRLRNALVRLPVLKAAASLERRMRARNARPLPVYRRPV